MNDRTSLWDNGVDVSNWNYDFTGQLTNDTSRPAATALNWNGLTIDQWNVLSVSGWDSLLVDHVPTRGTGMLEYSSTGNRLTQTDPVTGDVTTFTYDDANRLLAAEDVSGTTTYTYDANGNQETIAALLDDAATIEQGTYLYVKDSKVFFNPHTNLVVVVDNCGNFVSGWKLAPGTPQFQKYITDGVLK